MVVDGNNVVGAGAGGWWRDPGAAVHRLVARLECYAEASGSRVELVLDLPQADLPEGSHGGVTVTYARRRGRDAADERILEMLAKEDVGPVEVVTSDRALADGARRLGAVVSGAGGFLGRLDELGC